MRIWSPTTMWNKKRQNKLTSWIPSNRTHKMNMMFKSYSMRENITEADSSSNNNHFKKDNKRNCYDCRIINYNIQNRHYSFFGIRTNFGLRPLLLQRFGHNIINTAWPVPLQKSADKHTCLKQVLNPPLFKWPMNIRIYAPESITTKISVHGLT